ncbi:hypothetical protein BH09ACT8_BH09ACT8_37840 [soil metagenome]
MAVNTTLYIGPLADIAGGVLAGVIHVGATLVSPARRS